MAIEFDTSVPSSPKSSISKPSSSTSSLDLPPLSTRCTTQQSTRSIRFVNCKEDSSPTPHHRMLRPKSSASSISTTTSEKSSTFKICTCRSRPAHQRRKEPGAVHKAVSGVADFVIFLLCAGCVIGGEGKKKKQQKQQRWCLRCGGRVC